MIRWLRRKLMFLALIGARRFCHRWWGRSTVSWWKNGDWTAGCIAVSNAELREIFAAVQTGTVVEVRP